MGLYIYFWKLTPLSIHRWKLFPRWRWLKKYNNLLCNLKPNLTLNFPIFFSDLRSGFGHKVRIYIKTPFSLLKPLLRANSRSSLKLTSIFQHIQQVQSNSNSVEVQFPIKLTAGTNYKVTSNILKTREIIVFQLGGIIGKVSKENCRAYWVSI